MKIVSPVAGVLALALALPAVFAAPAPDEKTADYYPLKVGNTWTYKVGPNKVVVKVVRIDDGVAHLESNTAGDKVTLTEEVQAKADGVYRVAAADKKVTPPIKFLLLPPKKGESWEIDAKIGDEKLKGKFKVDEVAELTVGDKKYENVVVVTGDDLDANGTKISVVTHYAKDVGMIKQTIKAADQSIVLELEKFEPGK